MPMADWADKETRNLSDEAPQLGSECVLHGTLTLFVYVVDVK